MVEEGKIVEQGTHGELMEARGKYYGLYTAMMLREETDLRGFWKEEDGGDA